VDHENLVLAITNISCGVIFIAICIPLLKRKVKMNACYGFRIPKAFQSEENWFTINAYGARKLIIWSIPLIAIGISCFFVPLSDTAVLILGGGPLVLFTTIAIIQTLLYAKKL
jgi:hypothetical protein